MKRNIFSVQQNLSSITGRQEERFDRVRKYYQILDNNLQGLRNVFSHHVANERKDTFEQQEWIDAFTFRSPGRTLSLQDRELIISAFSETHHI